MKVKKSYIAIILIVLIAFSLFNVLSGIFTGGGKEEVAIHDQEFSHVEIDTNNADINLLTTNEKPYVELLNKNRYELNVKVEGNTLDIEVEKRWFDWFSFNFFFNSPTLNVYLPKDVYETIETETDNGSIHIANLDVHELNTKTNNGEVIISNVEGSTIYMESDNGDIELEKSSGKIIGQTNNGDIFIKKERVDQPISLETDNGNVTIITNDEPTDVTYQLKTHNGDISVLGSEHFDTVVGNGENLIQLASHNGNITIKTQ